MPLVDTKSCNARHVMGFDRFCRNDKIGGVIHGVLGGMGCYATMHYSSNDTSKSK